MTRNEELRLAGGPMQRSTKLIQLELADADARYAPADNLYVCATNSREAVRAAAEQFGYAAAHPPHPRRDSIAVRTSICAGNWGCARCGGRGAGRSERAGSRRHGAVCAAEAAAAAAAWLDRAERGWG